MTGRSPGASFFRVLTGLSLTCDITKPNTSHGLLSFQPFHPPQAVTTDEKAGARWWKLSNGSIPFSVPLGEPKLCRPLMIATAESKQHATHRQSGPGGAARRLGPRVSLAAGGRQATSRAGCQAWQQPGPMRRQGEWDWSFFLWTHWFLISQVCCLCEAMVILNLN